MQKLLPFLIGLIFIACSKRADFKPDWTSGKAPETYIAKFETTKGNFEILVRRDLSPKAADRLFQLIKHKYFDNAVFYRVVPGFVAQFGNSDEATNQAWRTVKIPDEPVRLSNTRGTVTFARSRRETRDLDLFINLSDNTTLDTLDFEGVKGFPAFGRVTKGMSVVSALYAGYGEKTMENNTFYTNRDYFVTAYPNLDLIKTAYLIQK